MRQAVVIIHGMGEQRPGSTLRSFLEGVRDLDPQHREQEPWSKPDRMSESFELRRYTVRQTRTRPTTDYYEYYWAHHVRDTTLRDVTRWVLGVLLRRPRSVPRNLRVLWSASWALLLGACYVLIAERTRLPSPLPAGAPTGLTSGALGLAFAAIQGFAIQSLGDVARYLVPQPGNVAVRHAIRSEAIQLLRRMHDSKRYDRIVIVGHSLGSVIGYDAITYLWDLFATAHNELDRPQQPALHALEHSGPALADEPGEGARQRFWDDQRRLWIELRGLGNPWLITDFVTLGSPLAHASILLAEDAADMKRRIRERELPTCPPVLDGNGYSHRTDYRFQGQPRSLWTLHHAAPFAVTRWTNVFFPMKLGLLGDWVGGPIGDVFGPGVRDVPVDDGLARLLPLVGHTYYWRGELQPSRPGRITALEALRGALELESKHLISSMAPGTKSTVEESTPAAPATAAPADDAH